ncbi:hypothetical protein [Photobacterium chitinilyticum]|uniref:Uncharacterized protein n=1 Tax=Photobacterium chitinilyticum TaxID=2485123 RepID=A0A3S3R0C0_9GAMM|nr:hypothetical protein [Photobacterium chitinilyticum]RWX54852.1 hypothetical protein EDI28_13985 [Photobacterium chitinilyticum]
MTLFGTFRPVYETHAVKPHLRDISMFVTLNGAKLYPREQFNKNGDIHPYLAPRLNLIKVIKRHNAVKWFLTPTTYQVWNYKVLPEYKELIDKRLNHHLKALELFEQSHNYLTASPESLLKQNDNGKLFNMFCDYMCTFNEVSIESREIPTTEWAAWFAEVSRIYQQTEEYKEKQRQHKAAIADCNIIKDDYDEENDVFYNRHHQERG